MAPEDAVDQDDDQKKDKPEKQQSVQQMVEEAWNSTNGEYAEFTVHSNDLTKKVDASSSGGGNLLTDVKGPEFTGGFWDWANKINHLGRREWNGYYIDDDGNVTGIYPTTGVAPAPGFARSANVIRSAKQAQSWLGKGYRVITNKAGDKIFMSKDGLRKMRMDIKNPHGDSPHMHLEIFKNGKWKDALPGSHRFYPKN